MSAQCWHGGQRGLLVGGRILPPSKTGATGTLLDTAKQAGLATPARGDRVYLTTEFAAALMFAVVHPSEGQVYLVEPVGELRPDPDCNEPGMSWECAEAIIRDVYTPSRAEIRRVIQGLSCA